jgi:hypothetical protein
MDLEKLEQQLKSASAKHAAGDSDALTGSLRTLCSSDGVQRMLSALSASPSRMATAARRSYWHSNGFLKIVLLACRDYKLRLHLWDSGTPTRREDIHNHRWDFASHMLTGGYRYQEFMPTDEGPSYFGYTYRPAGGTDAFHIQERGRQPLRCTHDALIETGTTYLLRAEVLHRVINRPGQITATLMLQAAARRPVTEIYMSADVGSAQDLPITWLETAELNQQITRLADYLGRRR